MPWLQYTTVRGSVCHGCSISQLEAVSAMVTVYHSSRQCVPWLQYTTVRGSECHGYSIPQLEAATHCHGYSIPKLEAVSAMVTVYQS